MVNPRIIKNPNGSSIANLDGISDTVTASMSVVAGESFAQPNIVLGVGTTFTNDGTMITEALTTTGAVLDNTGGIVKSTDLHSPHNISARYVQGDVSGTVTPSGKIGEIIPASLQCTGSVSGSTTLGTYTTIMTLSNVPAGQWLFTITLPPIYVLGVAGDTVAPQQGVYVHVRLRRTSGAVISQIVLPGLGKSTVNSGYLLTSGYFSGILDFLIAPNSYVVEYSAIANSGSPTITSTFALGSANATGDIFATRYA